MSKRKADDDGAAAGEAGDAKPRSDDVWVMCDNPNCQKWRRLPPRTAVDPKAQWCVP